MRFEVWAPRAGRVELYLEPPDTTMSAREHHPLAPDPARHGWWTVQAEAAPGSRYGYALDGGRTLPDPRSRRQPDGPDGLSAVVDLPAYGWRHPWTGAPLPGAVLYELHLGTFTPEGTFDAATDRLPHLAELGVTHVELLPVCPFPGRHGWGYDGVSPWAVHEPYGGPTGLQGFVDAAHGLGLGVVLDVVHNHLGPSGNHLAAFGPYFTDRHQTPWGDAVNLDAPGSDEVRHYLVGSAVAFLRDYRLDGLRLDAVHALIDTRAEHFLAELSAAVDALALETGRPLFLVAESDQNAPRTTAPRAAHGHGVHAQWNDDFHHALHVALTHESDGYYTDFAPAPLAALAKTLVRAFFHDGGYSAFRERGHGYPLGGEDATGAAARAAVHVSQAASPRHPPVPATATRPDEAAHEAAENPADDATDGPNTLPAATAAPKPPTFPGSSAVRTVPAVSAYRFLHFAQNHDQIGNRALGDRLSASLPPGRLACAAALVLLSPMTPMLFMGEEWGARTPWQYFTDHQDAALAEAVRLGRRQEFAAHGWDDAAIPDPQSTATRDRSCLDWTEPERAPHAALLRWHRQLIALRHEHPLLAHAPLGEAAVRFDEAAGWLALRNGPLHIAINLAQDRTARVPVAEAGELLAVWNQETRHAEGVLELPAESPAVLR